MPPLIKRVSRRNWHLLLFCIIFGFGIFLRFYQFPLRTSMELDSARDAFVALVGAKTLQLPLTGPFISIAPVVTGPWYWIQLILATIILPTSYAPWILLGIYSSLTILIMYRIGVILEGRSLGLILALVTALSPNQIETAYILTNPSVIAFFSSLVVLLFLKILKTGSAPQLGLVWGIVLGLTINTHYQTTGLLTLPLSLLIFKRKYLKTLYLTGLGLILTFIPLMIFELNNHWFNTRHLWQYLRVDQYKIWVPMRWLTYVTDFWPRFLAFVIGGSKLFAFCLILIIAVIFGYRLLKRKLSLPYVLLGISFWVQVVIIRYYRGERFFGYLQFFHPFLFIFIGYCFYQFMERKILKLFGVIAIIAYIVITFPTTISRTQISPLNVETKKLVAQIYTKLGPGPYKIYRCQKLVKTEVNALILGLTMDQRYSSTGKPLGYYWGCDYPNAWVNNRLVIVNSSTDPETVFPSVDAFVKDYSLASPSALLEKHWEEASPESMYQSAARWWMDEQP